MMTLCSFWKLVTLCYKLCYILPIYLAVLISNLLHVHLVLQMTVKGVVVIDKIKNSKWYTVICAILMPSYIQKITLQQ